MSRADFFLGVRTMLPMQIGMLPFGLICGVAATSAGFPVPVALAMSAIVFSGTAQLVAAQLYSADAPTLVILLSCVVVSLRFLMYSAALAPHLRDLSDRWKVLLSYLLTDQVFAAVIQRFRRQPEHRGHPWFFLGAGLTLWLPWQVSNAVGVLVGAVVPASWSLDFVVPLSFLALVAPLLRERAAIIAALGGAIGAVALFSMPMKLGMICGGMIGIAAGMGTERLRR